MSSASAVGMSTLAGTTRGTLIRLHPDLGPLVVKNILFSNASLIAESFAADLRTIVFTAVKIIGNNWWLVDIDHEQPTEFLPPWPIAGFITREGVIASSEAEPEWAVLALENGFLKQPVGYETIKEARAALVSIQSNLIGKSYIEVTICGGLRLVKKEGGLTITIAIACRI